MKTKSAAAMVALLLMVPAPPAWARDAVGGAVPQRLRLPEMELIERRALPAAVPASEVEQTVVPLPPAAWTGLVGLGGLALASCRKRLARFLM